MLHATKFNRPNWPLKGTVLWLIADLQTANGTKGKNICDLSMRETLVLTSAYGRTSVRTNMSSTSSSARTNVRRGGGQCHLFLAGNRMTIVAFEKAVSLKA